MLCRECSNSVCSPRCPYMMTDLKVIGRCKKCGSVIVEGDEAIDLERLLPYDGIEGYICEDCAFRSITEIYLDDY